MSVKIVRTEREANYIRYYCEGAFDVNEMVDIIANISTRTLESGIKSAFIDVTNVSGNPDIADRFILGSEAAGRENTKKVNLAFWGYEPLIESDDLGETVARNRGVSTRTFHDETETIAWIKSLGQ